MILRSPYTPYSIYLKGDCISEGVGRYLSRLHSVHNSILLGTNVCSLPFHIASIYMEVEGCEGLGDKNLNYRGGRA